MIKTHRQGAGIAESRDQESAQGMAGNGSRKKCAGIPGNRILQSVFRNYLGQHHVKNRSGKRTDNAGAEYDQVNE